MPSIELASVSEKTLHFIAFWEFDYQSYWLKTIWTDRRKFTLWSKTLHGEYGRDYARRTSGSYDGMPVNTMATMKSRLHMKSRRNASQSSKPWNQMASKVILVEEKKTSEKSRKMKKIERILLFRKQTYWRHREINFFFFFLNSINFCPKRSYGLFEFHMLVHSGRDARLYILHHGISKVRKLCRTIKNWSKRK